MKVTNVSINKLKNSNSNCKGFATVILDDCLAIHDIRIIEAKGKRFIAMPSKKFDDKYYDYVHPVVNDLRNHIEECILNEFDKIQ